MNDHIAPPKWPSKLVKFFLKDEYLEEIEGDMEERFQDNLKIFSPKKARRLYAWEALKLMRPALVKRIGENYQLNHYSMFRHNLILVFRNFSRYRASFLINLLGLTSSLVVGLLIYLWVYDELQVDSFHERGDRLYQVMHNIPVADGLQTSAGTPGLLAQALQAELPEIEKAAVIAYAPGPRPSRGLISTNDETGFKANAFYVSPNHFDVFSFRLVEGNGQLVLDDKNSVVISEELAMKLFESTAEAIGETINWELEGLSGSYTISGVLEKPGPESSLQFDLLFSYDLLFGKYTDNLSNWGNSNPMTYALLREGTNHEALNEKIKDFIKGKFEEQNGSVPSRVGTLFLQSFEDRYLFGQYQNGVPSGGRIQYVWLFSAIGAFILLIACINFMNLSTSLANYRMKEIGVKKAMGAPRKSLVNQYLTESVVTSLFSLVIAVFLVVFLLPGFNQLTEKQLTLDFDSNILIALFVFVVITGFASGSYPSLYLSGLKPVSALNGELGVGRNGSLTRRGLVTFQFIISIVLITCMIVLNEQMTFLKNTDLGFQKAHVIRFLKEGKLLENSETFLDEVRKISGVEHAASIGNPLPANRSSTSAVRWPNKNEEDKIEFGNLGFDYGTMELLDLELINGRSFSSDFHMEESKIIFNEAAIAAMEINDPVGKTITLWGDERQIIGVVKDFHFASLYQEVKPCFIRLSPVCKNILLKINPESTEDILQKVEVLYREHSGDVPFEYTYMDDDHLREYKAELRMSLLSRYFSGIAILISCLGLFALTFFTIQRKAKEVSIRKVLGSGVWRIMVLLTYDLTKVIVIALFIALPISYFITTNWLSGFAYRIELSGWLLLGSGLLVLPMAWLIISTLTVKMAYANPLKYLRNE